MNEDDKLQFDSESDDGMMNSVNVDTNYNRELLQQEQPEDHNNAPVLVENISNGSHLPDNNEQQFIKGELLKCHLFEGFITQLPPIAAKIAQLPPLTPKVVTAFAGVEILVVGDDFWWKESVPSIKLELFLSPHHNFNYDFHWHLVPHHDWS